MQAKNVFGLIGIIIFLVFVFAAVASNPGYDFSRQYLSELGTAKNGFLLNIGLIASGASIALFFVLGFKKFKATRITGTLASIALMGVGFFPLTQPELHDAFAAGFFVLATIAILFFSAKSFKQEKQIAAFGFLAAAIALSHIILQDPITQKASIGFFLLWIGFAAKTIKD